MTLFASWRAKGPSPLVRQVRREGCLKLFKEALVPGLTVGCMVVPQAIAYALLAGLPPIYGLYSSTVGVFVYACLGSSPQLAVGPVALVSLLTKGVIDGELSPDASESEVVAIAIVLSFLVGVVQLLLGVLGLGGITTFLSHDVLTGFTAAAAIIIAFSQLKYVFGINVGRHHYPWETWVDVFQNLPGTKGEELAVSLTAIALLAAMKIWRKRNKTPPPKPVPCWWRALHLITGMSALVIVVVFTPLSALLAHNGVNLKIVGPQPSGLRIPALPDFASVLGRSAYTGTGAAVLPANASAVLGPNCTAYNLRRMLLSTDAASSGSSSAATSNGGGRGAIVVSAVVIALIGFMESFAVAVSVEKEEDEGVDANQELFAIGLANMVGSIFGAYPSAGSFGRTAVSSKSGARSPVSGAITGCFVVLALLFMMPAFEYLPYCALSAIIEVAVVGLIDVGAFRTAWRVSKPEFFVSLGTFVFVLGLGIELGILVGAALSIGFALRRAAQPHMAELGKVKATNKQGQGVAGTWRDKTRFTTSRPSETIIMRVDSAVFFANCDAVKRHVLDLVDGWEVVADVVEQAEDQKQERLGRSSLPSAWGGGGSEAKKDGLAAHDEHGGGGDKAEAEAEELHLNCFVLHLSSVDYIDLSAVHMLHSLDTTLQSRGVVLALSQPRGPVRDMLMRAAAAHGSEGEEHGHAAGGLGPLFSARTFPTVDAAVKAHLAMTAPASPQHDGGGGGNNKEVQVQHVHVDMPSPAGAGVAVRIQLQTTSEKLGGVFGSAEEGRERPLPELGYSEGNKFITNEEL